MPRELLFPGQTDTYEGIQRNQDTGLWLARGRDAGRLVSVRVISPGGGYRPGRVFNEARILKNLESPYVARILDFGQNTSAGEYYIFLEVLEGRTLERWVRSRPMSRLEQFEALQVFSQIVEGLSHVHAQNVVHRNLRPSNIVISPSREVKIWDFGIARSLEDGGVDVQTLLLSHAYLAPEQIEEGTADKRSDLYAAGGILYFMLAGHPPFEAGDWLSLARKIVSDAPLSIRWYRNDVVEEIDVITQRCMAKQPAKRFQSAQDLLSWIRSQGLNRHSDIRSYLLSKVGDYLKSGQIERARDEVQFLRERYPGDHDVTRVRRVVEQRWRTRRRGEVESTYAKIMQARERKDFAGMLQAIGRLESLLEHIESEGVEDRRYLQEWREKAEALRRDVTMAQGKAMLTSVSTGQQYLLTKEESIVGRSSKDAAVDVDLSGEPENRTVSRKHARIVRDGVTWYIHHLSNVSPTIVGGTRAGTAPVELSDGVMLQLGKVKLHFSTSRDPERVRTNTK